MARVGEVAGDLASIVPSSPGRDGAGARHRRVALGLTHEHVAVCAGHGTRQEPICETETGATVQRRFVLNPDSVGNGGQSTALCKNSSGESLWSDQDDYVIRAERNFVLGRTPMLPSCRTHQTSESTKRAAWPLHSHSATPRLLEDEEPGRVSRDKFADVKPTRIVSGCGSDRFPDSASSKRTRLEARLPS